MLVFGISFFSNFNQLPAAKKGFEKRASLQMLGPSYFIRALVKTKNSEMRIQTSFGQFVRFSPSLLDQYNKGHMHQGNNVMQSKYCFKVDHFTLLHQKSKDKCNFGYFFLKNQALFWKILRQLQCICNIQINFDVKKILNNFKTILK